MKSINRFSKSCIVAILIAVLFVSTGCAAQPAQPPKTVLASGFGVPGPGNVLPLGLLDSIRYVEATSAETFSTDLRLVTGVFMKRSYA